MLPILICDDMKGELKHFEKIIRKIIEQEELAEMHMACVTTDPYEILKCLKQNNKQSIYFLDIDLKKDINGIELAAKIREYDKTGFIIMLTAYEMQAVVFRHKLWAIDYILKSSSDLNKQIKDCLLKIHNLHLIYNNVENYVTINMGTKILKVNMEDIYCIVITNAKLRKLKIMKYNGEIELTLTMSMLEKQLSDNFFKCSRTCIINLNHIVSLENGMIILDNKIVCTASRRKMQQLINKINKKNSS